MTVTCTKCGDEIDLGDRQDRKPDDVYLTVTARVGFRDSWSTFGRLHVDCFLDAIGEGEFDAGEWAERVSGE